MTGLLVAVGVPVAAFTALVAGVWHHRGRNHGRHVAPARTHDRSVTIPAMHTTMPIAHTRHRAPWDEEPEPDDTWVADLRAALDEVEPSGWVKPELHHILAAPTLAGELDLIRAVDLSPQTAELVYGTAAEPAHYGVQFDEQGREVGWLPDPYDMWGTGGERCPACECRLLHSGGLHCPRCGWMEAAEPSPLADTADHAGVALAVDVAGYMAAQDADATRYGEDLAGWCAGQLRALRETLCAR